MVSDALVAGFANPASQHRPGQLARRRLEELRRRMLAQLGGIDGGMRADQLLITSGGTESNNLALLGLAGGSSHASGSEAKRRQVLISAVEHPSIFGAAEQLVRMGYEVIRIPVDRNGVVLISALESLIRDSDLDTALVSVMLVNNETGTIEPVEEIAALCRSVDGQQILVHTDAVQAIGKMSVDFRQLGVDAMSFTAHKFGGPRGVGGLLLRHGVSPEPILFGGFQQSSLRPGTEDVALAVGMGAALDSYFEDSTGRETRLRELRDLLESKLKEHLGDQIVINGADGPRAPHTSNLAFAGIDRQSFLLAADFAGLAISTGSACASGSSELSPVLLAMGVAPEILEGSIRISLGISTTAQEIELAVEKVVKIVGNLCRSK